MSAVAAPGPSHYMRLALEMGRRAGRAGEVPVGAVVVAGSRVIARAANDVERSRDPLAHAEMRALARARRRLGNGKWLPEATLYVTLEPCAMCAGAIVLARVGHVVFGALDPKAGAFGSVTDFPLAGRLNHVPRVTAGVMAEESAELLSLFFASLRRPKPPPAPSL